MSRLLLLTVQEKDVLMRRSHLMTTVEKADKIYVLEKGGKVVQCGTHKSLVQVKDGAYAKLWRNHMGEHEIPIESIR